MSQTSRTKICDFEGRLDRCTFNKIEGWARDKNNDDPVFVNIFIDGGLICTVVADYFGEICRLRASVMAIVPFQLRCLKNMWTVGDIVSVPSFCIPNPSSYWGIWRTTAMLTMPRFSVRNPRHSSTALQHLIRIRRRPLCSAATIGCSWLLTATGSGTRLPGVFLCRQQSKTIIGRRSTNGVASSATWACHISSLSRQPKNGSARNISRAVCQSIST